MSPVITYSPYLEPPTGSSGSGLDQVLSWIARDPGLAGANEASSIATGIAASHWLNTLLVEGLRAIGALDKPVLGVADKHNAPPLCRARVGARRGHMQLPLQVRVEVQIWARPAAKRR